MDLFSTCRKWTSPWAIILMVTFADNSDILASGENIQTATSKLQLDINIVYNYGALGWITWTRLTLILPTHVMITSLQQSPIR